VKHLEFLNSGKVSTHQLFREGEFAGAAYEP